MTGQLPRGVMWDVKASRYVKKKPRSAFARYLAGWVRLQLGSAKQAAEYFNDALLLNPYYAPACIGKICVELRRGKFHKAIATLFKYSDKLKLDRYIGSFRLCCALSACALLLLKETRDRRGRSAFSPLGDMIADVRWRKLWTEDPTVAGVAHLPYLKLIRYIELLCRENTARGKSGAGARLKDEKAELATAICRLPGLLDEFRLYALNEIRCDPVDVDFVFDNPALFTKALLNAFFREKIFKGDLRVPRIILTNLRRDSVAGRIGNANKWLFLKSSLDARRNGDAEAKTAHELNADGWWADPIVRRFL